MTRLLVARGPARAALAALVPHAGRATDRTPDLGRARAHVTSTEVVAFAARIARGGA